MIDEHAVWLRYSYVALAALAGAITALAFKSWREMSRTEISLTLVAGFSFAIFVTPWLAESVFGVHPTNVRAIAALTYIFGSGSNILLPLIIRWVGRVFGNGETK